MGAFRIPDFTSSSLASPPSESQFIMMPPSTTQEMKCGR